MSISSDQITATAQLAKLKLNASEIEEVTARITAILDLVDQMQSVDTSNVEPMAHPLDAVQRLRVDQAKPPEDPIKSRDQFLTLAPASEDGLFLVPKVIE